MKIRLIALIAGLLCGFAVISANAEIYQWTDSYGTINFTDDLDKVPAKYKAKVFEFTKEHKWSVDNSDTAARNAFRLEELRGFITRRPINAPPALQIEPPQTTIIIENHCGRNKRHRSTRAR